MARRLVDRAERDGVVMGRAMVRTGLATLVLSALLPISGSCQEVVIFVSDRDGDREVYSMDQNGHHQVNLSEHPGRDQAPALSPEGKRIAWVSDRSGKLGVWLMATDGSGPELIREIPEADFGLAWSPSGEHLAITLQREDGGTHDLALLDVANGQLRRLTNTPKKEEITPTYGPEGEALYYVAGTASSTRLMRYRLASGAREVVAREIPSAGFPMVSPAGDAALVRSRTDQFDVLRIDLATGTAENLTRHAANDWGAVWSRDGRSITFASDRDGDMEIYVLDLASGTLEQLTNNDHRDWMPSR